MKSWTEYASCATLYPLFLNMEDDVRERRSILWNLFEGYEQDDVLSPEFSELANGLFGDEPVKIRDFTDKMCLGCPVIAICFEHGVNTKATGIHGGIFLTRGKIDNDKNSHKTEEEWEELWSKIES